MYQPGWECAPLGCNTHDELENIGPLCRDGGDCVDLGFCQNGLDELRNRIKNRIKNPWPGRRPQA